MISFVHKQVQEKYSAIYIYLYIYIDTHTHIHTKRKMFKHKMLSKKKNSRSWNKQRNGSQRAQTNGESIEEKKKKKLNLGKIKYLKKWDKLNRFWMEYNTLLINYTHTHSLSLWVCWEEEKGSGFWECERNLGNRIIGLFCSITSKKPLKESFFSNYFILFLFTVIYKKTILSFISIAFNN